MFIGGLSGSLVPVRALQQAHTGDSRPPLAGTGMTRRLPPRPPPRYTALVRTTRGLAMLTVLIVDDEPENVELLKRRLGRRGFGVLTALSADEAVRVAAEHRPAVVLMDIKMPVVDGFEATQRLKADPDTRSIPVIALTAHAMQEDRDRAFAAGASEYETKPVDLDRLIGKITALAGATA